KIREIRKRQFAVQSADDVQLSRTLIDRIPGDFNTLFNRMSICTLLAGAFVKPAKLAIGNADIRVVKMAVDVVIRRQPMLFPTNKIRQLAKRIQIIGLIERHPLVKRQTLAILDLVGDISQMWIK